MFNTKKEKLFDNETKSTTKSNSVFVDAGMKKSKETLSGNGSLKYESTNNDFVDQFGKLGTYKKTT